MLAFFAFSTKAMAQNSTLRGTVKDSDGLTLIGVNVVEKGTTNGTVTDMNGNFSINVPANATIVFTYIGFSSKEESRDGRNFMEVILSEDSRVLEEVVVTALGLKKAERNLGYAVTQIESDAINTNKTVNVQSALMGKVAGLDIGEAATGIGGSKKIVIRGISSISTSGDSSPLWVVDGIPINSGSFGRSSDAMGGIDYGDGISGLNPDDIESISVLKGNAAAALYGSRASNGVIIVTTKSGTVNRKGYSVEISSTTNFSTINDMTDWQYEYGQGRNGVRPSSQQEALVTGVSSWGEKLDGKSTVQFDGVERPYSAQKNNMKNFYSDALLSSNTIAISRNLEHTNFRLSFGHTDSKDFVETGKFRKRNMSINAGTKIDWFSIDISSMYINEGADNRQYVGGNVRNANYTLTLIPSNINVLDMKPGYNPDGSEIIFTDGAVTNPYFVIDRVSEEDSKNRLLNAVTLRAEPLKDLYVQGKLLQDYYFFRRKNYQPEGMNWQPFGGELREYGQEFQEMNYELTAGYRTDINQFSLNAMFGGNIMYRISRSNSDYGTPFVIPGIYTLNNTLTKTPSTSKVESQTNSLFGMAEFGYNKYLYLTLTGRNDWFSTLPIDNNNLFYPSASLSFVFSDVFKMPKNIMSYGKLRGSYARVSGGADPYSLDLEYMLDSKNYDGQVLQKIGSSEIPNKNLRPLISTEYEIGLETRMFDGFLYLDVAFYNKQVKDDIVSVTVSNTTGYKEAIMNTGNINNYGIEAMVELKPIHNNKFTWTSTAVFAKNYNKVISLGGDITSIQIGRAKNDGVFINIDEGQPYGVIKGSVYKRDDNGNIIFDDSGYPMVGDGSTILGVGYHDIITGWTNRFDIGNFSLSCLLDAKFGGSIYSQTNRWAYSAGKHKNTLNGREDGIVGVGVKEDGTVNDIKIAPENLSSYYGRLATIAEEFVYDASYIKLREISLTYFFPNKLLSKTAISRASVSLTGRNLLYLMNKMENISPESHVSSSNVQGLENSGYPEARTFGLNFNLTF
jgi:TonB-linked SusC/RagA family outer membrane protein